MRTADLEHQALELRPRDRAHLIRVLLDSLDGLSEKEIEELWLDEAERRDRAIEEGKTQTLSAREVLKEARARLA